MYHCEGSLSSGSNHLVVDGVGLQRGEGLVEQRQVGDAATVAPNGVVGGPSAQHNGPGQIHWRPAVVVQHIAHPVCANHGRLSPCPGSRAHTT